MTMTGHGTYLIHTTLYEKHTPNRKSVAQKLSGSILKIAKPWIHGHPIFDPIDPVLLSTLHIHNSKTHV
jgi:hypothetical protein